MTTVLATLFGLLLAASSSSRVVGTLVGDNGQPIAIAHAHLGRAWEAPVATVAVQRDGRFTVTTTERGMFVLKLTGVGYESYELPVWLDGGDSVEVRVTLGRQRRADKIESVKVTGDFNKFSRKSGKVMVKRPDGTYVLDVPAQKPFKYQILGVLASGYPFEGQTGDTFEWGYEYGYTGFYQDGYRAVATPKNGMVHLVFDPSKLARVERVAGAESMGRPENAGSGTIVDASSVSAALRDYDRQVAERRKDLYAAQLAHHKAGKPWTTFTYDWSPTIATLRTALRQETRAPLREAMTLELWSSCAAKPRTACTADEMAGLLQSIPPESTMWGWMYSKAYDSIGQIADLSGTDPKVKAYATQLLAEGQPSRLLKTRLLSELLMSADAAGRTADIAEYHGRLLREYPQSDDARRAAAYGPNRKIRPGQPLPAFTVASLKDKSVSITNADVKGKTLLIDVWATWCPGCRLGNPTLHTLYEKYRGAGLEILSVSADDSPDEVAGYRAGKNNPMPWLHGYIGPVRGGPFMKLLEVSGYPTYILTDPQGTILLKSHSHEDVEQALAKALGQGTSSTGTGSSSAH
jgi:thiol-disulfide isomerase/thioredoxin